MPQWAALAQFLADLCRDARVEPESRRRVQSLRIRSKQQCGRGLLRAETRLDSSCDTFPDASHGCSRIALFCCSTSATARACSRPIARQKNSNLLATLSLKRRMIVDARAKQVSLLSEFPLRSSNGALNGSLTRSNQGLESRWSARPGYFSPGSQKPILRVPPSEARGSLYGYHLRLMR